MIICGLRFSSRHGGRKGDERDGEDETNSGRKRRAHGGVEDNDMDLTDKDIENTVACKILSNKGINVEHLPKIWGVEENVQLKKTGKNMYICKFKNRKTKRRVGDRGIKALDFRYVNFWVDFHNLPVVCLNRKYAIALANSIGAFVKMNEEEEEGRVWGETLRVKVKLEANKPLRRGTKVKVGSMAEEEWIPITIEKLPDFCYQCGTGYEQMQRRQQ